jgi:hypothetical protein
MSDLAVVGAPEDLGLAALEPHGDAAGARVVVSLREGGAPDALSVALPGGERRLIAPAGDGVWRLGAWPAADALFELDPPAGDAGVLVAGGDPALRGECAGLLAGHDVEAESAERLTVDGLRRAAVVVLLAEQPNLPAEAPAVLAAGRTLVTGPCELCFGLAPGVEFLRADTGEEAAQFASIAFYERAAFDAMRVLGRLAARPQRASAFYARLLVDLELEGAV